MTSDRGLKDIKIKKQFLVSLSVRLSLLRNEAIDRKNSDVHHLLLP